MTAGAPRVPAKTVVLLDSSPVPDHGAKHCARAFRTAVQRSAKRQRLPNLIARQAFGQARQQFADEMGHGFGASEIAVDMSDVPFQNK